MSNVGTLLGQKPISTQGPWTLGLDCYTCFNARMKNFEWFWMFWMYLWVDTFNLTYIAHDAYWNITEYSVDSTFLVFQVSVLKLTN